MTTLADRALSTWTHPNTGATIYLVENEKDTVLYVPSFGDIEYPGRPRHQRALHDLADAVATVDCIVIRFGRMIFADSPESAISDLCDAPDTVLTALAQDLNSSHFGERIAARAAQQIINFRAHAT